ncbi:MAG: thioredoxin [Candidatus Pacearchaeota archaeon]
MVKDYSEVELTEEEFNKIINNSHDLVVVDFFAEWCMPCLMLSPIIEDLSEQMSEVKFVKINIDENENLASKFRVSSVPCLVIFKNGKEAGRIVGAHSSEVIEERIVQHMN